MKKSGSYLSATALGSVTAVAALLIGLSGANAQAPQPAPPLTGAGSFPGSFIVPGTNTSLHVGGVVELDTWYDTGSFGAATSPGADAHFDAQAVALKGTGVTPGAGSGNTGTWYWTSQFSRFNFETRTPTPYGELKTYIEVDFDGSATTNGGDPSGGGTGSNFNQGYLARVKQAYAVLGPFLMGQTSSLYADLDAWADTLDAPAEAGNFMGVTDYRIPQIRYTYLLPGGLSAAGSVEMMQSAGIIDTGTGAAALGNFNDFNSFSERWPAVVGNIRTDQPWGHVAFHVVVADEQFKNLGAVGTSGPVSSENQWGFQSALSGHLNTIGQDKLTWSLGYGIGAAQYSEPLNGAQQGGAYQEGLVCSVASAHSILCSQAHVMGLNAGYSHHWTSEWRSTLAIGLDHSSKPSAAGTWTTATSGLTELSHNTESAALNLLWKPLPAVQFGLENDYYWHTVWSGAHGTDDRIHFQALFSF